MTMANLQKLNPTQQELYNYLEQQTGQVNFEVLQPFTTQEMGTVLHISRNTVSQYLNEFFKAVGVFDDEGVGVGNVQTGLNDGGAYQHLNLALRHGLHHVSQRVLAHLAVGDAHADARNPALDCGGALVDGFRAVVQIVDLPAPLDFPADGVVHNGLAVFHHEGLHGIAVSGGLLDGGHVPDAGNIL